MAPSHRAHAPQPRKQDTLDTASTVKSFQQDTWDTTPLKLPGFWAYIKDRAPKTNIKWRTLVELGYTMSKREVYVYSVQHAIDLQSKSYGPYSFDDPSPLPHTGLNRSRNDCNRFGARSSSRSFCTRLRRSNRSTICVCFNSCRFGFWPVLTLHRAS